MRISYQRKSESQPSELEVRTFAEWRDLLWDLGCGLEKDDQLALAFQADTWRKMVAGEFPFFCLAVSRGSRYLLGTMEIKVLGK